jgi:hypothetical protein
MLMACSGGTPLEPLRLNQSKGPLRFTQSNPHYFTDGSGKAIYLTGSHNWNNLVEGGNTDLPDAFDYKGYLNFLNNYNHNFIRLWAWRAPKNREKTEFVYHVPQPWPRTGPGMALDGKPKFDLNRFNQLYFDRLRSRVVAARDKGMYVSIMLFEGWWLASDKKKGNDGWTWHPFNIRNNINGISADSNGDGKGYEFYTLSVPLAVKDIQKTYIKKVVDTVNDLDNVLYEIVNEATPSSTSWQYEMVNYLKNYESTKPKQHPVGMTSYYYTNNNVDLFNSPADWISPGRTHNFSGANPPVAEGKKVILLDTDHIFGLGGDRTWVWKSFLRGYNPIYMDRFDSTWEKGHWHPEDARRAMGHTLTYATKMNLISMVPHNDLSSTTYCLANPGSEYLIYKPMSRNPLKHFFTVNLKAGTYKYEWFNPRRGVIVSTGSFTAAGGNKFFIPPLSFVTFDKSSIPPFVFDDWVLYIYR